jgi:hypothetical protein
MIVRYVCVIDVWVPGRASKTGPATRAVAEGFTRDALRPPAGDKVLTWKPMPWVASLDDQPREGEDVTLVGCSWMIAIQTTE